MSIAALMNPFENSPIQNGGIYGVVLGIVTNNQDEDNLGRVKLRFPWLSDGDESFWARLAMPMAGAERGMFFLPDVDDEVLVAFEHGDINRPYVVGALWSGTDKPPLANDDGENNIKQIKTRSGHTITLNDTDGEETIEIIDKTESNKIIINSAENTITVESAGDLTLKAPDGVMSLEAKEVAIASTDAMTIESGASLDVESSQAMTLKGATIDLN